MMAGEYYEEKNDLILTYICPILGLCGFLLHSLSFLVYSNSKFKELLYKYLKMESLNVLLDLLITSLKPIYFCRTCDVSRTHFVQIYFIAFMVYGASILELSAIMNRNLSTLCCLILLRKKFSKLRITLILNYYKILNLIIFVISALIFVYQVFEFKIVNNENEKFYNVEKSQFSKTTLKSVLEVTSFIFRDGINLSILILLNIFIFICFKNDLSKKKAFFKSKNSNTELTTFKDISSSVRDTRQSTEKKYVVKTRNDRIKQSERKQTIMVFLTCLCCITGRLPILIYYILSNLDKKNNYKQLDNVAVMIIYLTYVFNFFLYYQSNRRFKQTLIQMCSDCLKKFNEKFKKLYYF
ncbi:unnamed protein product [Brachionus calyciflorus]|uniref:G-protein coupled receptors family 1 profile domain-containing protein n=1 Tax=Brachionus calyciflorus TaxID=104777 RepID=A0A813WR73_9BILA|nr:unnamed protein product [Brachionus calyciflorus]